MSTWITREPAPGPGLRVGIKDLIDVAGLPTTAACRAVADTAVAAERDAACLAGLREAIEGNDAALVGKTNLHELAFGITGVNAAFGTPLNPLDPARVPGGSSSGSAVAVATGEADVAYGSDTGGSIRIPAACCGVAGLKTTRGRVPLEGVWPLAPDLDTVGPLARDVAGLVAGMALLEPGFAPAGAAAVIGRIPVPAEPDVDAAVDAALAATGWELRPAVLDRLDEAVAAAMTLIEAGAWSSDAHLVRSVGERLGEDVRSRLLRGSQVTAADVERAGAERVRWQATLGAQWGRVQLLAVPTLTGFPPTLDAAGEMGRIRSISAAFNLAGVPALALPVPSAGPLPASVQLIGPTGSEELLLAAGAVLEAAAASA